MKFNSFNIKGLQQYLFKYLNKYNLLFVNKCLLLHLHRASLLRSAPFELPQGGNTARVKGCSGAIEVACPFYFFRVDTCDLQTIIHLYLVT